MLDLHFCAPIYIEAFLSDGAADAQSAAKRRKSMFERTAGSDLAVG
jgi:hypothetical protein